MCKNRERMIFVPRCVAMMKGVTDMMGIGIRSNDMVKRVVTLRNIDGSVAGRITSTSSKAKSVKKKKRLPYNFNKVSNQILMSKTANNARAVQSSARRMTAVLAQRLRSGEYDEEDLKNALVHAKRMERIAKKRVKHMQEEERARQGGTCFIQEEQEDTDDMELLEEEQGAEMTDEELEELMQELEEMMQETLEELEATEGLRDLADEMMTTVQKDMAPEDLDRLKKKHRADEMREIMEANMKYLKALFNKLEREKRANAAGSSDSGSSAGSSSSQPSGSSGGVSMEIMGTDVPVQTSEAPAAVEGGSVDIMV
ncbi:MAG: hypothetical protein NC337_07525 [Roseburia sp.]|nr:hypothetical protein [Roseburia sp.]